MIPRMQPIELLEIEAHRAAILLMVYRGILHGQSSLQPLPQWCSEPTSYGGEVISTADLYCILKDRYSLFSVLNYLVIQNDDCT